MKHLIIYAHHRENSLNNAILNRIGDVYKNHGHQITVRNLYETGFNPVLTAEDLASNQKGMLPEDIKKEQAFLKEADIISFVYPVWWTGFPAIMKGYFDRVLLYGFAYSFGEKGLEKLLTGKKALLFSTHGLPAGVYEPDMYKALNLTSNTGVMEFCGIEVLNHEYFASATSVDENTRLSYLRRVEEIAEKYHNG